MQPALRHCSTCIEWGHDKATCRGCRATNHTRNSCPNVPYSRRPAGPVEPQQHMAYIHNQRQRQVQQGQLATWVHEGSTFCEQAPTMLETPHPQVGMNSQNPTQTGSPLPQNYYFPGTQHPPLTWPQSHGWNGSRNLYYWICIENSGRFEYLFPAHLQLAVAHIRCDSLLEA